MSGEGQPNYIEGLDKPLFRFVENSQEGGGTLFCNTCGKSLGVFGLAATRDSIEAVAEAHWCPNLGGGVTVG